MSRPPAHRPEPPGPHADMLARLIAEARDHGCAILTLRAIVEEASELGAERALARTGLADPAAQGDLGELRELLGAWRDAKRSAWKAAIAWTLRGLSALLLLGIAVRMGLTELLK